MASASCKIAETDLLLYTLALEKGYHEILDLYGILFDHSVCPHCKRNTGSHHKSLKDIVETFGGASKKGIQVPAMDLMRDILRNITIWKGLSACMEVGSVQVQRIEYYAQEYSMSPDNVLKIHRRMDSIAQRFLTLREAFRGLS